MSTNTPTTPLLEVHNLVKRFALGGGWLRSAPQYAQAVDGVSFTVQRGETLGLVGESGCGKTTISRTILRLVPATAGSVVFDGTDVFQASARVMKNLRRDMQIIFQDPTASLDPRITIGESVAEGLLIHRIGTKQERLERVREVLEKVSINTWLMQRYPHAMSGGQLQRIGIARALIMQPKLIICDEPVSALDVSVQSQVLNLLRDLQDEMGLAYLFIAHNLSVVEHISHRVAVMYLGKIVELARREELFRQPLHPYTRALISAIPIPDPLLKRERIILTGDVPGAINVPTGCRFHPRCWIGRERERCRVEEPAFVEKEPGHWSACHYADEVGG